MKELVPIWFDIDGTLLHTTAGHGAFRDALREIYGWEAQLERIVFAGNTDLQVLLDMAEHHEGDAEWTLRRRHSFFERMSAHLDANLHRQKPEPVPGAVDLLRVLHADPGVVLGLITGNARACAFIKLEHAQMDHAFSHGGFGDEHADRNVLARMARSQMQDVLGDDGTLTPGWVIGDTPRDVAAAKTIGARCLGVASGAYSEPQLRAAGADHVVTELHPTQELLALLTSPR